MKAPVNKSFITPPPNESKNVTRCSIISLFVPCCDPDAPVEVSSSKVLQFRMKNSHPSILYRIQFKKSIQIISLNQGEPNNDAARDHLWDIHFGREKIEALMSFRKIVLPDYQGFFEHENCRKRVETARNMDRKPREVRVVILCKLRGAGLD
jgi:hypothetical protein